VQAVGRVDPDGSRYLLGDTLGNLHMLVLSHDSQRVVGLKLEALGRISAPSTISYLDSGVVFVVCPICPYGKAAYVDALEAASGLLALNDHVLDLHMSNAIGNKMLLSSDML
jgi:hypothetical protein